MAKNQTSVRFPPPAPIINPKNRMKLNKTLTALVIGSLLAVGYAFAAETAKEAKSANCCVKAEKDGKACGHECCVAAAKEGKNCEKCGGSGKIEVKKADAKH